MSRIVSMRADRVSVPFRRPFPTGAGMWVERDAWLVRVIDDDGRTGFGEAVLEPADGETAATVLRLLIREAVESAATGRLPTGHELEEHGRPGRSLRAALDAALDDLASEPAPTLLHGGGVGVNATLPALGPSASAEAARQAVAAGFRTLKLKVGAERETETLTERVGAVRSAVGPDVRLRLDANGAWDMETAAKRLAGVARFEPEYVEQPLGDDDPALLATLRRRARVPVAADESVASARAARALLDADAVDVLVVKPSRVGGPVVVAEIAAMAADRGVPVVVSTLFETGIGIAAALRQAAMLPGVRGSSNMAGATDASGAGDPGGPDHGLATAGLLEHDLLADGLPVDDGRMWLPAVDAADDGPTGSGASDAGARGARATGGLGVTPDERAIQRYRVESTEAVGGS